MTEIDLSKMTPAELDARETAIRDSLAALAKDYITRTDPLRVLLREIQNARGGGRAVYDPSTSTAYTPPWLRQAISEMDKNNATDKPNVPPAGAARTGKKRRT